MWPGGSRGLCLASCLSLFRMSRKDDLHLLLSSAGLHTLKVFVVQRSKRETELINETFRFRKTVELNQLIDININSTAIDQCVRDGHSSFPFSGSFHSSNVGPSAWFCPPESRGGGISHKTESRSSSPLSLLNK